MRVRSEAPRGLDAVVVDHAQGAETEALRIVMLREGEAVAAVEPAGVGVEPLGRREHLDHGGIWTHRRPPGFAEWPVRRPRIKLAPWSRSSTAIPEGTSRGLPVRRPRWRRSSASPPS